MRALWLIPLLGLVGCATEPPRHASYASTWPAVTSPPARDGAIYHAGHDVRLFEDLKARRVGDILTILLVERTDASKKASTSVSKANGVDFPNPTLFGKPFSSRGRTLETSIDTDQEFEGEGDSSQSNALNGRITVMVSEVYPNGYLRVQGEKIVTLNQGDEYLQFSGIVRPEDIGPDNTVLSTRVADVRIAYTGRGTLADANTMGWLTRFFLSALWPF